MNDKSTAVIILAAGHGTRMRSARPKVLHEIGAKAMIAHVIDAAQALAPERMAVVIGDHAPAVGDFAREMNATIEIAVQSPPQGTAHAVEQALPAIVGFSGVVLVLYADTPLVTPETLRALADIVDAETPVAVLGFTPEDPGPYGRLKQNDDGALTAIVEAKDASPAELEIGLCNSGVMAFDAAFLQSRLGDIENNNAKKEYYLTDMVGLAHQSSKSCAVTEVSADEVLGVNSRVELALAEAVFQLRMRHQAMEQGVTLLEPEHRLFLP